MKVEIRQEPPEVIEPRYTLLGAYRGTQMHRKLKGRHPKQWWPEEMKIAAVAAFAASGSVKKAAELAQVPYETVRRWKQQEWWADYLSRVRLEKDEELDAKFTKTVDKVLDLIDNRITEGETVYDTKRGTLVSVPMSSRDAVKVGALAIEKRQLLRGAPTSRTEHIKSGEVKDKLTALAEEFKKFSKARDVTPMGVPTTITREVIMEPVSEPDPYEDVTMPEEDDLEEDADE